MIFEEMEDEDIVILAQQQNDEAITYLMEKYKNLVRKKARSLFLTGGDKDDLIQEGMIGLYKAIKDYSLEKEASFRTFAELCISRQIYSAIKSDKRMKNQPLNTYISIYTPEFSSDNSEESNFMVDHKLEMSYQSPEEIILGRERVNSVLNDIFRKLSKMEKKVFEMYLTGMTYREIASYMDKTPKSIDNALRRIKLKVVKK